MRNVHFVADFDYRQDSYITIAYTAGFECEVDDDCAARAVAAGAAKYSDFAEDDLIEGRNDEFFHDVDDA